MSGCRYVAPAWKRGASCAAEHELLRSGEIEEKAGERSSRHRQRRVCREGIARGDQSRVDPVVDGASKGVDRYEASPLMVDLASMIAAEGKRPVKRPSRRCGGQIRHQARCVQAEAADVEAEVQH